jgi:hypothetical protein
MSAACDRARQEYQAALIAARQAAARAVEAMDAYALVATTPWRHSPKLAAEQMRWELEFAAEDVDKRRADDAKREGT